VSASAAGDVEQILDSLARDQAAGKADDQKSVGALRRASPPASYGVDAIDDRDLGAGTTSANVRHHRQADQQIGRYSIPRCEQARAPPEQAPAEIDGPPAPTRSGRRDGAPLASRPPTRTARHRSGRCRVAHQIGDGRGDAGAVRQWPSTASRPTPRAGCPLPGSRREGDAAMPRSSSRRRPFGPARP
jgi:hypothetical protein